MPLTAPRPRPRFHPLTVVAVRPLTKDAVEVVLAVPDELAREFTHTSGQYVTVRADIDGQEVRRSYSLCAPPTPGELHLGIKRGPGGLFSTWAHENLRPGQVVDVMSPTGTFTARRSARGATPSAPPAPAAATPGATPGERPGPSRYVAVAAGSGITPVVPIVRSVLEDDPDAHIVLVYVNRTSEDVMFADDLADLKDRYPTRLALHHVLSREPRPAPLHTGRLDAEKLHAILGTLVRPDLVDEWFLCGPADLVRLVRGELAAAGVDDGAIRHELFTTA
ncbi:FAD-binding oxidoreductase [Mobilicoccus pelagius]|uniref:Phenylacetate-CoA oxygenase subunit PaaE n=1 Tax=Mobilicoccus pelagius NBRC 104925 TaxID=1089455 RepID=H5UNP8_9MICO|nr:FAD-binding oxidoreductase [Mobilicoccus pelagius]GAB47356.1 phenylacetate-CoA oxygenase subunit PaaE [Mobilicoccus pelagius NBRC 104925]